MPDQTLDHATYPDPATPRSAGQQFGMLLRLACELARGALILWLLFPRLGREEQGRHVQRWARRMLLILRIDVRCDGVPAQAGATLVVSNHVSWLDVLVIQSVLPGVFVAKTEVQRWPVIGRLSRASGTIFVDRLSPRSTRRMVERAAVALQQGRCVTGFPEGTSSDGAEVAAFHANLFDAAIKAGADVQPLALRYVHGQTGRRHDAAAFTGSDSLVSSMRRILATDTLSSRVQLGERISTEGQTRRALAARSHQYIREQVLRHERSAGPPQASSHRSPSGRRYSSERSAWTHSRSA